MKINSKLILLSLSLFLFISAPNTGYAQGGLAARLAAKLAAKNAKKNGGKAGSTKSAKAGVPYAEDFTDAKGISGTYTALDGVEYKNANKKLFKQKTIKVRYIDKKDGEFLQKLTLFINDKGVAYNFRRNGKMSKKYGFPVYNYIDGTQPLWMIEVEKGLFFSVLNEKENHSELLRGTETVTDVFAKDAAKLEVYDMEVASAKWQQLVNKGQAKDLVKMQEKMMGYKAYKENVGKVTFANQRAVYNYSGTNKPTEDPKNFLKTATMANSRLYLGSYLKTPLAMLCGSDCEFNYVYEMNGKKVSRVALRNSAPNWNKEIKRLTSDSKYYNVYHGLDGGSFMDYAYMYLLYQNKDQFAFGKSYKLTVKVYSNRDENDVDLMAEGSIQLKYDAKLADTFNKKMKWVEEILEE